MTTSALLPDLLSLTGAAVAPAEAVFESAKSSVRELVSKDGRVSGGLIEEHREPYTPVLSALLHEAKALARQWTS